jgi:hypothetical protein
MKDKIKKNINENTKSDEIKKNQNYKCNDEFKTNLNLIKELIIKIKDQNIKS